MSDRASNRKTDCFHNLFADLIIFYVGQGRVMCFDLHRPPPICLHSLAIMFRGIDESYRLVNIQCSAQVSNTLCSAIVTSLYCTHRYRWNGSINGNPFPGDDRSWKVNTRQWTAQFSSSLSVASLLCAFSISLVLFCFAFPCVLLCVILFISWVLTGFVLHYS